MLRHFGWSVENKRVWARLLKPEDLMSTPEEAQMREQYPRTALFGTEERTLFCPTLGREYHLSVALPDSYRKSTQAYPVIYVLDGDFLFGMAAGLTRFSNWFRRVPKAIIVGISYGMESYDQ
jgi:enterochelin esterase-like enzyme